MTERWTLESPAVRRIVGPVTSGFGFVLCPAGRTITQLSRSRHHHAAISQPSCSYHAAVTPLSVVGCGLPVGCRERRRGHRFTGRSIGPRRVAGVQLPRRPDRRMGRGSIRTERPARCSDRSAVRGAWRLGAAPVRSEQTAKIEHDDARHDHTEPRAEHRPVEPQAGRIVVTEEKIPAAAAPPGVGASYGPRVRLRPRVPG
jgi:hypothetical protein